MNKVPTVRELSKEEVGDGKLTILLFTSEGDIYYNIKHNDKKWIFIR